YLIFLSIYQALIRINYYFYIPRKSLVLVELRLRDRVAQTADVGEGIVAEPIWQDPLGGAARSDQLSQSEKNWWGKSGAKVGQKLKKGVNDINQMIAWG